MTNRTICLVLVNGGGQRKSSWEKALKLIYVEFIAEVYKKSNFFETKLKNKSIEQKMIVWIMLLAASGFKRDEPWLRAPRLDTFCRQCFRQPNPENRSSSYAHALPRHSDDVLKRISWPRICHHQTVQVDCAEEFWKVGPKTMEPFPLQFCFLKPRVL